MIITITQAWEQKFQPTAFSRQIFVTCGSTRTQTQLSGDIKLRWKIRYSWFGSTQNRWKDDFQIEIKKGFLGWVQTLPLVPKSIFFLIRLQCKSLLFYTSEIRNYSERLHPPCLAKHRTTTTICRNSASHLFTFFFYTFNRTFASVIVLLDYCVFFFKFRTFFRPPIVFIHIIHISQKYVSTPWFNTHSWVDSWILHLLRAGHADVSADAHQMRINEHWCASSAYCTKRIFPFVDR